MMLLDAALAVLPILVVLAMMIGLKRSAALSGAAGLLTSVVLALTYFQPHLRQAPGLALPLLGAGLEGVFTAGTILWIIFGALCIFQLQERTGAIDHLRAALARISDDPRVIALVVAWFFALFAEGAAGFGTSVALTAPFLVSFGFGAVDAVVATMIGHGIGVSFGAVGIVTLAQAQLVPQTARQLSGAAASFHVVLGLFMLAAMVRVITGATRDEEDEAATHSNKALLGWALLAGVCYLVPMYVIARFVGPELPTLGGALGGGLLFVGLYRLAHRRRTTDDEANAAEADARGLWRAASPYLLVVALVLATRLVAPVGDALGLVNWSWTLWGEFEGKFEPLSHPGTLLMVGFLAGALIQRASLSQVRDSLRAAVIQLVPVALALTTMLGLSRVMAHTGMIDALAAFAAQVAGGLWPLFAPWVGLLGSFVTGSGTTSNILFSEFQLATATRLGLPPLVLLGAQNASSGVGSIVAPSKIIAGGATVGVAGEEGSILRRLAGPCLVYVTLVGLLALLRVYVF